MAKTGFKFLFVSTAHVRADTVLLTVFQEVYQPEVY